MFFNPSQPSQPSLIFKFEVIKDKWESKYR